MAHSDREQNRFQCESNTRESRLRGVEEDYRDRDIHQFAFHQTRMMLTASKGRVVIINITKKSREARGRDS